MATEVLGPSVRHCKFPSQSQLPAHAWVFCRGQCLLLAGSQGAHNEWAILGIPMPLGSSYSIFQHFIILVPLAFPLLAQELKERKLDGETIAFLDLQTQAGA